MVFRNFWNFSNFVRYIQVNAFRSSWVAYCNVHLDCNINIFILRKLLHLYIHFMHSFCKWSLLTSFFPAAFIVSLPAEVIWATHVEFASGPHVISVLCYAIWTARATYFCKGLFLGVSWLGFSLFGCWDLDLYIEARLVFCFSGYICMHTSFLSARASGSVPFAKYVLLVFCAFCHVWRRHAPDCVPDISAKLKKHLWCSSVSISPSF